MNYLSLTSIPLFTGISGEDLALILDRVDLIDIDLSPGEVFVQQGDVSHGMAILRDGTIQRYYSHKGINFKNARKQEVPICFKVKESINKPIILEPEVLFGLDHKHQNSWQAETSCHLTLISKDDIRKTLMYVPVWRINFINMLCTKLQRSLKEGLPKTTENNRKRSAEFFYKLTSTHGTALTIDITLEMMAETLGIDRRTLQKDLKIMEEEKVITKEKKRIIVPDIDKLKQFINE